MNIAQALVAFAAAAGLLTITPGLDTALVLRTAAVEGSRRAMWAGTGICLGCLTWGLAASVGLGALLDTSKVAYNALHTVGACYLIFLGTKLFLRARRSPSQVTGTEGLRTSEESANEGAARWFARGFLTNMLNPKVGVFYVTFLPLFVPRGINVTAFSILLASIHATQGMLWFSALIIATRPLSTWLRRPRVEKSIDRTTGAVLVGLGLKLLLDRRR
jgi:threonine/homoserine/homoserine lactone efflux protein